MKILLLFILNILKIQLYSKIFSMIILNFIVIFQSHCNYHLNSMLLGYNSIAIKVQKQWDCGREEYLYEEVRLWGGCSKWGKESHRNVKLDW